MRNARHLGAFLIILGLFQLLLVYPTFAQSVATIKAPTLTVDAGQTVPVEITAENVTDNIVGIQGSFSYDPTVITVTNLRFHQSFEVTSYNIENGIVRFVATLVMKDNNPIGLGDATLFTFDAQAIGAGGTMTDIDLNFDLVKNMGHQVLVVTIIDGKITITEGVHRPPTPNFTWEPQNPVPNGEVTFTDLSTDQDGFLTKWVWDFGDGTAPREIQTASESAMVKHTYVTAGVYDVTLTVTNNWNISASVTKQVSVGAMYGTPMLWVFPNPCIAFCKFFYKFPKGSTDFVLYIFNIRGEKVFDAVLNPGTNEFRWDMRGSDGRRLPNGPYFFYAQAVTPSGVVRTPLDVLVIKR